MSQSIDLNDLPATDDETRRDRWGRYLVVPPQGGDPVGYTRATTIAKVLDSGGGLASWKAAMAMTGLMMRSGLRAKWEALVARENGDPWYNSQNGKRDAKSIVEDCATVGGASDRAQIGLALHAITALVDAGKTPRLTPETAADVAAYQTGLVANGIALVPGAIELTVVLDTYQVGGTFDRLARVKGRELPLVTDLKTGGNLDYSWQSFAVQLAIYSRSESIYQQGPAKNGSEDRRHPMPAVDQEYGLIFWLNAGTANLEIYEVDLNAGWEAFQHSMWTRGWRSKKVSFKYLPSNLEEKLEESLKVVATAQSRRGGKLDCGHIARPGENIFKVDTGERGSHTQDGNGLGGWICMPCAHGTPAPEVQEPALQESVEHHPSGSQLSPPPAQPPQDLTAPHRAWLQSRIDVIGQNSQARTAIQRLWPEGVPPLKASSGHTSEQLVVIEKVLDDVERRYEIPFPPPSPAVAKVINLFPGSSINQPSGDTA